MHYTLYTTLHTLNYSIQFKLNTIEYTLYTIHCTLYTIHYALYTLSMSFSFSDDSLQSFELA